MVRCPSAPAVNMETCSFRRLSKALAQSALDEFVSKWGSKYRYATNSLDTNWEHLSEFFTFSEEMRKVMYTTNIVEGYHRQLRKATKTKGAYPCDDALLRHVFLVYRNISAKSGMVKGWQLLAQQLHITFGDRFKLD